MGKRLLISEARYSSKVECLLNRVYVIICCIRTQNKIKPQNQIIIQTEQTIFGILESKKSQQSLSTIQDRANIYTHKNSKKNLSIKQVRKEGNVLFNNTLNTFYLKLYGVRHMVKDHSDSEKRNPLPPHGLLFPISSKGSFICMIPHT